MIAVLVGLAIVFALEAVQPRTATTPVLVAVRDVPGLVALTDSDVAVRELPSDAVPQAALTDPAAAVGRRAVGTIAAGEIITGGRVAGAAIPRGRTAVPVRFDDDAIASVLAPGDAVDLVSEGRILARTGVVLRIHRPSATSTTTVVVVHVDDTVAATVAAAASTGNLWVTLPSGN